LLQETLKNTNLYVSSIPDTHANEDGLRSLFEEFGKIINIKVRQSADLKEFFVRHCGVFL
jgi:RNA recognition motif-containing protein